MGADWLRWQQPLSHMSHMTHSPNEQEALESSIEVVPMDSELRKLMIESIEGGHKPRPRGETPPCRRITILNQGADYSVVFDRAGTVISDMKAAYEEMFENWKLESQINSELLKEVASLEGTVEGHKKYAKMILDQKSQVQEALAKFERTPKLQSKVDDLETEIKSLKIEIDQLTAEKARQNAVMAEQTKTLEFYRSEFGGQTEADDTFRPRVCPIRRIKSTPDERRVNRVGGEERKGSRGEDKRIKGPPSKLLSKLTENWKM